jgi:hypothetical protein
MLLDFWRKLLGREPPLTPTASTGRPRTYSADSGYVYEYSFAGFRRIRRHGEACIEYVFEVSGARVQKSPVAVVLAEHRLREWVNRDRDVTASERYGIAKLALKRALDRFPDPHSLSAEVAPDRQEVAGIADVLDL